MIVFKLFGFEICNVEQWSCLVLERYCSHCSSRALFSSEKRRLKKTYLIHENIELVNLFTAADSSQIQFTDPANDDCKPTKKMGSVDLDLHFKGRIYDKEKDTTTFQYQFQRLLQESENVIFGITNCFPGSNATNNMC